MVLAALVAAAAFGLDLLGRTLFGRSVLPLMVGALLVGILLAPIAASPRFEPGLNWCVKRLLRMAIALLGLRIALADIAALGVGVAVLVVVAMATTLVLGIWLGRRLGVGEGCGALAGAATAVCGASATLATATVLPRHPALAAHVTFTVIAANAVSTAAMLAYPPLASVIGLDPLATGILLGATIHDMAQVVGAGYAVSEPVGNTAVIVKLFRVALLLPVVLAIGWWFARSGEGAGEARVPPPVFAVVFLALVLVNSAAAVLPEGLQPLYAVAKAALIAASDLGLLLAISALGLTTSVRALLAIGWRPVALFGATTIWILALVATALVLGIV